MTKNAAVQNLEIHQNVELVDENPISTSMQLWQIDHLLDSLDQYGFAVLDDAYSKMYVEALEQECTEHFEQFKAAAIQNGIMSSIRSDHILWLNQDLPVAAQHLTTLSEFSQILNQAFFLGLRQVEAHFARYEQGEFYALHRDNPQQKNHRVISTVFYIHANWQAHLGGELRLQDKLGNWHTLLPESNRIIFFQSDLLHEVLPTKAQRLSITAWLRSDDA